MSAVNRHYFNIDEMLAEIVEGRSVPELPAIAPERLRVAR